MINYEKWAKHAAVIVEVLECLDIDPGDWSETHDISVFYKDGDGKNAWIHDRSMSETTIDRILQAYGYIIGTEHNTRLSFRAQVEGFLDYRMKFKT